MPLLSPLVTRLTGLPRRWLAVIAAGAVALTATGVGLGVGLTHRGSAAPIEAARPTFAVPTPLPVTSSPEPTPAQIAVAAPANTPPVSSDKDAPPYSTVFTMDIASINLHLPVASVPLKNGSMDAPFGPLSSPVWHEAFWLNLGAEPGQPGTLSLAGHLDDTAGQPAAFWTVRQVKAGDIVTVTRNSDGSVARYRITDVHAYTDAQANSAAVLTRFYGTVAGGPADGVARIALITCTGRFVRGEYDHRFFAFGELVPPGT